MFYWGFFFLSLAMSQNLSLILLPLNFKLWSARAAKFTIRQILISYIYIYIYIYISLVVYSSFGDLLVCRSTSITIIRSIVFHWSLSDSKSLQVSRTLLSILAVINNSVVWMVSTHLSTSKSSSPFSNPLVTVPKAPITIGIIVTFMFHSFFNSLARSWYLSFFSHSFGFILWSAKTTILQVLFSFFFFFFFC